MPRPFLALFAALFAALLAAAPGGCSEAAPEPAPWTVACVLSYDNDLEPNAAAILDRLEAGVRENGITVTVLADYRGPGGLVRYEIDRSGRRATTLGTDDSASEKVVAGYLDWVRAEHPAERYAVIFLDHGGGLDEMCQDLHPPGPREGRWLSARKLGPMLRTFREKSGDRVELLFLQQCGRGTLECLYDFRGAARTILASQTRVGAPNTYYTPVLRWLGGHAETSGRDLAIRILRSDQHFNSYVAVDGAALEELPARLDEVLREAESLSPEPWREPAAPTLCYRTWIRPDEEFVDCLDWLEGFYEANRSGAGPAPALDRFRDWIVGGLIVGERRNPRTFRMMSRWTGLGMLVPRTAAVRERYRGYPLYEASGLDEFWERLFTGS